MATQTAPAPEPQGPPPTAGAKNPPPWPPITLLLCAMCVCLFTAIAMWIREPTWDELGAWGYPSPERVWDGAYWGLLSSTVVHLAPWHVAFNVYWLWKLGSAVERTMGPARYSVFLLGSAWVSSSAQLGTSGTTGHGASGLVYAMFGLMWMSRRTVPGFAALTEKIASFFWIWLVGCIVASRIADVSIANAAHVGGLLFGALAAQWMLRPKYHSVARWATIALVLASLLPLFWNPWSATWVGYRAYKAHAAGRYDAAISGYQRSIRLGGDRVWALQNLALVYHSKGSKAEYSATVAELRALDADAATAVEQKGQSSEGGQPAGSNSGPTTSPANQRPRPTPGEAAEPRR